jgi:hypothetical protein
VTWISFRTLDISRFELTRAIEGRFSSLSMASKYVVDGSRNEALITQIRRVGYNHLAACQGAGLNSEYRAIECRTQWWNGCSGLTRECEVV